MAALPLATTVTSADVVRQFGRWQDLAASQPVVVTHHGRGRLVLLSTAHYEQLTSGAATHDAVDARAASARAIEQLMDHVAQGFVAFRADMTVSAINAAACAYLKTRREAVIDRRVGERLPGVEETLGYASLARAAASGDVSTFEMPSFAYPDRWLLFRTFPIEDGAACLFRDITDEQAPRRLADARTATLAALATHAGVGRATLSLRGTFAEIDDAFAGLAGFTAEGLARARLTDVVAPRGRVVVADAVEAVLEGGPARAIDVALLTRQAGERDVRLALAPLRNQAGPAGAVVVMTGR